MTTKRWLALGVALIIVGAVVIGHIAWHNPAPTPKAKLVLPPSCQPAPVTMTAGSTFTATPGECLTIPAGGFTVPAGATVDGGDWIDSNNRPCPYPRCAPTANRGRPAILVKAPNVTLEDLSVAGINVGGYRSSLAFNSGIEVEGASDTHITNVNVAHVFGDCLDLEPQRSGSGSNGVVAPVSGLVVNGVSGTACGRNGLTCASVDGATVADLTIGSTGQDPIDCEADVQGEGAKNLTINGCTLHGLINITAGGASTGPITVDNCTWTGAGSADAIRVVNLNQAPMAGVLTFSHDTIRCGASKDVACITINGPAVASVTDSTVDVGFGGFALAEPVFHAGNHTELSFSGTTVSGRYKPGTIDSTSKVVGNV